MLAALVDRVQLEDDRAELWVQPARHSDEPAVEIGMRWQQGVSHVRLLLAPVEATMLAHRLIKMAAQAHNRAQVATDEQFPDF